MEHRLCNVGGTSLTNAAIVSKLHALIAAVNATNTARASLHALVLAVPATPTANAPAATGTATVASAPVPAAPPKQS